MWVDTHCHLQLDSRSPTALLERAKAVDWVVVPGVDATSSEAAAGLASEIGGRVLASAGLHPHDASEWEHQRDAIAALAPNSVAIGETGLDFYRDLSPRNSQKTAFRDQVRLGLGLAKPVIVHCRDAFEDTYRILSEEHAGPSALLHCWTGGPKWTRRFVDLGVMFSYAGPLAFETGDTVRRGAEVVPPGRAVVETDTPYLTPPPHRGQPNEPANVALIGAALADVWGLEVDEVARSTSAAAGEIFGR